MTATATGPAPALRDGVEFVLTSVRGGPRRFLVRDGRGALLTLGEGEVFLCRHLDGRTPLAEVRALYEAEFGTGLAAEELEAFVRQLGARGLLRGVAPAAPSLGDLLDPETILPVGQVRLARCERLLGWLARRLRWVFGPVGLVAGGALALCGVAVLAVRGRAFVEAIDAHWSPGFLVLVLALASAAVWSPRAAVTGIAAKRCGAEIAGVGLVFFLYLLPRLYCDYRGVVQIGDRRRRLLVLSAGLVYQLAIWGLAMLAWTLTWPGTANSGWLALAVAAGATLLLFTGNPLTKMDAYHLLAAWLDAPRLRERALATLGSRLLGRPAAEPLAPRERRWFLLYGALVLVGFAGHVVTFLSLVGLGLVPRFQAGGIAATLALALLLAHRPLGRALARLAAVRWLLSPEGGMKRWIVRAVVLVVLVGLLVVPYPYETGGPFTIIAALRSEVHCEVDGGRVTRVFVREGDPVRAGQPLGEIDTREYERNVRLTEAQLGEAESRLRLARKELALLDNPPNIEAVEALEAEVRRLQTLLADQRRQLELTTLRSPIDGRVTTPLIEQSVGKYLRRGDLFAAVEQSEAVEVQIQVPEADAPQVRVGAPVKVVAWAFPEETFHARVKTIAPLALVTGGGERAVRAVAELSNPDRRLTTQITGFAKIRTDPIPVWLVLSRLVLRWFRVQVWYWLP